MKRQILAAAVLCAMVSAAQATPITISTPFMNLEHRNINSLGFGVGSLLRVGVNSAFPNGANGTTGTATTTLLTSGQTIVRDLIPDFAPASPNFFSRYFTDVPAIRGPWTLNFTNGADTASTTVSLAPDVASALAVKQAPFVNTITMSGNGLTPTFTWTAPPGATVNGYRVNIYDKTLVGPNNSGNVVSRSLQPSQNTYTVDTSHFNIQGYAFDPTHQYSIEISIVQTKDGRSNNLGNGNLLAIARSYADFTPTAGGGPVINLPVVLANGSYQFDIAVAPGQTYYIDPDVAVGYDYAIGTGNPNFLSVDLPDTIGDGLYDIYGYDLAGQLVLLADDWNGANVFSFGPDGVTRFRVTGIETSARLDPNSTTAFITGLTFTGAGQFTGTQTPITVFVDDNRVPEPSGLALAGLGLLGLLRRRRAC